MPTSRVRTFQTELANFRRRRDTALGLCGRSGDLSRDEPKGRLRERSQARSVSDAQLLGVRRSSRLTHKLESRQVMRCRLVRRLGGLQPLGRLLDGVLVRNAAVCGGAGMRGTRFALRSSRCVHARHAWTRLAACVAYAYACTPHLLGMKRLGISRRSEKGRSLVRASRPVLESPKKITSTVGSSSPEPWTRSGHHVPALPTSPRHTSSCFTTSGGPSLGLRVVNTIGVREAWARRCRFRTKT